MRGTTSHPTMHTFFPVDQNIQPNVLRRDKKKNFASTPFRKPQLLWWKVPYLTDNLPGRFPKPKIAGSPKLFSNIGPKMSIGAPGLWTANEMDLWVRCSFEWSPAHPRGCVHISCKSAPQPKAMHNNVYATFSPNQWVLKSVDLLICYIR